MTMMQRVARRLSRPFSGGRDSALRTVLSILRNSGADPQFIVDVGANRGQWTRTCLKYFPNSQYLLFEPQEALLPFKKDLMAMPNVDVRNVGLGRAAMKAQFTIHERDDSRSFSFSEEEAKARGFEQVSLEIEALDDVLEQNGLPAPDFIKSDAEGWDLEVLNGASRALETAEVVFVEAGASNRRVKNDLLTVLNYMHERGFSLFDFSDLNRPFESNLLWLVEAAFVRTGGKLDNSFRALPLTPR